MTIPTWLSNTKNTLTADAWDHTTVRLSWDFDIKVQDYLDQANGVYSPMQIALTRSISGTPVTPLDGVQVFKSEHGQDISPWGVSGPDTIQFPIDVAADERTDDTQVRPYSPTTNSVYDRNLLPGRVYYYSAFLFVVTGDTDGENIDGEYWSWVPLASGFCRLAGDFNHSDKLYERYPPYYRYVDQLNLEGTYRSEGYLEQFTKIIGQHLDQTRATAENIQQVYDVDKTDQRLLKLLGETNFGMLTEPSLGDIRYRSMVANLHNIQTSRGSLLGIRRLAQPASQYYTRVTEGTNFLRTVDDCDFSNGIGFWTPDVEDPLFAMVSTSLSSLAESIGSASIDLTSTPANGTLSTSKEQAGFPTRSGSYAVISPPEGNHVFGAVYGMGTQVTSNNRLRQQLPTELDFYDLGIPLTPRKNYRFSVYIRHSGLPTAEALSYVRIGVVVSVSSLNREFVGWVNAENFYTNDASATLNGGSGGEGGVTYSPHLADTGVIRRYSVSFAPTVATVESVSGPTVMETYTGGGTVSALTNLRCRVTPYILFSDGDYDKHISGAMLTTETPLVGGDAALYPFIIEQ